MLDDLDRRLLRLWQADPSLSPAELGERSNTNSGKVARRLARMQDNGVIEGIGAIINWPALGYGVEVSLRITLDKTVSRAFDDFLQAARDVPQVTEIQTFLGRVDVRLSIIARDMSDYQHVYRTRILTLPHVSDIEALMQVAQIKADESLPL